jgi:hypothetical protein
MRADAIRRGVASLTNNVASNKPSQYMQSFWSLLNRPSAARSIRRDRTFSSAADSSGISEKASLQALITPSEIDRRQASGRVHFALPVTISLSSCDRARDFPVGLVFAQCVDRPDRCRDPANNRDLKREANDPGKRPANREELKPGQENCEQEAHGFSVMLEGHLTVTTAV